MVLLRKIDGRLRGWVMQQTSADRRSCFAVFQSEQRIAGFRPHALAELYFDSPQHQKHLPNAHATYRPSRRHRLARFAVLDTRKVSSTREWRSSQMGPLRSNGASSTTTKQPQHVGGCWRSRH